MKQWMQRARSRRVLNRIVDQRLRAVEAVIDYRACADITALAAQIAVWAKKPIEIAPFPFPGEIAALVVGTPTKYAIRYSILAHPMLQITAICHEFGHIILGDVAVCDGQTAPRTKMRTCRAPGDSTSTSYDPLNEAQAERLGTLLRNHWERAYPTQGIHRVPSMSPSPQEHLAWDRFQTYFPPFA